MFKSANNNAKVEDKLKRVSRKLSLLNTPPIYTGDCKRGFSDTNLITDLKTSLNIKNVSIWCSSLSMALQLHISIHGLMWRFSSAVSVPRGKERKETNGENKLRTFFLYQYI